MKTRAEYLEASLGEPWIAEGISKATWYRRRTKRETGLARIKLIGTNQTCLSKEDMGGVPAALLRSPTPLPVSPDLSHPMSALRYWSPGVPVTLPHLKCAA